jgi:outer membrane protein assembly factor BamB
LWLPATLSPKPKIVWRTRLQAPGLGGIAATHAVIIVSDRELNDTADAFYCLDAKTGTKLWSVIIPTAGHLDFGNSPRATPLIDGELVYLASAFGEIECVKLANGELLWDVDLRSEFKPSDELPWGLCASPLIVDGNVIVNPGAKEASLVALNAKTGAVVWKCPGAGPAYGSFLAGKFGGRLQIVGHDADSLGGWDAKTGKRLWRLASRIGKGFGVPTPVAVGDRLLSSSENSGTRLYKFGKDGVIDPHAIASNDDLAPDCHTPVVVGGRVFGVWNELLCLDLSKQLATTWRGDDPAFAGYASLVASSDRLLAVGVDGEVVLVDVHSDSFKVLGRAQAFTEDHGVYSHPALVGSRLYIRGSNEVLCIDLEQ